jgi:hypothetical protein
MDSNKFKELWEGSIDKAMDQVDKGHQQFRLTPVPPKEFFEVWMKEPLFPEQYRIIDQIFTKDYQNWNTEIKEILLLWGEGASKDFTVVHTLVYCAYWLMCLRNPQEYFHIGSNTPIVIACMSVNEDHAKDVFFKQFTTCIQAVINPSSGRNFFEEMGVDLREGKDIQTRKLLLPNHIQAYALDASRYSGEGKNILIAIFDEIAEVRFDRAKTRYENLQHTAFSRFPDQYKIVMISYPRDEFDFMMSHYNEVDKWEPKDKAKVFKSCKAPWEIRTKEGAHPLLIERQLYTSKEDYLPMYKKNPEDAMRRYECKFPKATASRYLKQFDLVLDRCIKFDKPSPLISENSIYVTEAELLNVVFQPWFKPQYSYEAYLIEQELIKHPENDQLRKKLEKELERHDNAQYFVHIDLSRGIKDCAGLALIHPYRITPTQIGYYTDLAIQIRPDGEEINFEDIRKFVFKLSELGFEISMCTLDGFQSIDFQQILERKGIQSNIISVDRNRQPYDTLKGLLYQGRVDIYSYLVLIRELKELRLTEKSKVDHPAESVQRLKEEGLKAGSKDVADALAGAIYAAVVQESDIGTSVVDDTDVEPRSIDDIF